MALKFKSNFLVLIITLPFLFIDIISLFNLNFLSSIFPDWNNFTSVKNVSSLWNTVAVPTYIASILLSPFIGILSFFDGSSALTKNDYKIATSKVELSNIIIGAVLIIIGLCTIGSWISGLPLK
jgi:hypothetical protein